MKIKIAQLGEEKKTFGFSLPRGSCERIEAKVRFEEMVCSAEVQMRGERISLKGDYKVDVLLSCDNCLKDFKLFLANEFGLDLILEGSDNYHDGEGEITLDQKEIDYYQGVEVDLARYFEDQLILDLPFSARCSEECSGICPVCGTDLNLASCDCETGNKKNPFAEWFDKMNKTPES